MIVMYSIDIYCNFKGQFKRHNEKASSSSVPSSHDTKQSFCEPLSLLGTKHGKSICFEGSTSTRSCPNIFDLINK